MDHAVWTHQVVAPELLVGFAVAFGHGVWLACVVVRRRLGTRRRG